MRLFVKICGLVSERDVLAVVEAGADAAGFVFAPSPRRIDPRAARRLARLLPSWIRTVAVFLRPALDEVRAVLRSFTPDVLQLELSERLDRRLPDDIARLAVVHDGRGALAEVHALRGKFHDALLLEGAMKGGTGASADVARAAQIASTARLVLAGGLTPENVADRIERVRPFGVDVSSGVESAPGKKDARRIVEFVQSVRRAEAALGAPVRGR